MENFYQELIMRAWRKKNALFYLVLIPLSWIFGLLTWLRCIAYRFGILESHALPVPVIVVGNINMGGSGKTPVVIWLVEQLRQHGYKPAVISRGFGGRNRLPTKVELSSAVRDVGDEPLLIAKKCACPVWIGADRARAGLELLNAHPECDVIISDDGLQHYRLRRDYEIVVVDEYSLKNTHLLPAGPLREGKRRLSTVDAIICNGKKTILAAHQMHLEGRLFYNLKNPALTATATEFKRKSIKAIAGIGNPERFFECLRNMGLVFIGVSFKDHYAFTAHDLARIDSDVVIMTEKDAVKCSEFAEARYWVLPVEAKIEDALLTKLLEKIDRK